MRVLCNETFFSDDVETLFLDALSSYVCDNTDSFSVMNESINYNPDLKYYFPLLESVKELKDCEESIKELKENKDDEKVIDKLLISLKKVWDWYFKADPDKKFKTFHIILRICINLLIFILPIIYPYGNIVKSISHSKIGMKIPNIHLPRKLKPNSILHKIIDKIIITTVHKGRVVIVREGIILNAIRTIIIGACKAFSEIIHKAEIKSNLKDIDANIKYLDTMIDSYNKMIEESNSDVVIKDLKQQRSVLEDTLAKLIKIKEESKG